MVSSIFKLGQKQQVFEPKIFLTEKEQQYSKLEKYQAPCIMLGVLGSTPQKSMPYDYVAQLIDFITENYKVNILFNYAPHQKKEALKIYELCKLKEQIIIDVYEDSIRGFIQLMDNCDLLVANEGGAVHIAKALQKPTFTIFSPYVLKENWASFEDGCKHTSVHLIEEKPELYNVVEEKSRRDIEKNPQKMYKALTPVSYTHLTLPTTSRV